MFLMRAINSLFSNDINCSIQNTKDMPSEKEDSKSTVRDQISFCNLKTRTIVINVSLETFGAQKEISKLFDLHLDNEKTYSFPYPYVMCCTLNCS